MRSRLSFFLNKVYIDEYILFLSIFLIFISAICPTIYAGDSSLFAAASFSLGSAHPPGYPLFIIIGKLLTFLPFGNIAFKVNLVNALFGSLACLMVFKTSMELHGNRFASFGSALICGISPLFFIESAKAEVYTLNSFLAMLVFYLGLRILKGGNFLKLSLSGFFIIGLGFGNHHTIGFMGLIFLYPVMLRWKEIRFRWVVFSVLIFAAGFSINLFLFLRSVAMDLHGGLILYSHAGGWHEFVKVFLRKIYKESSTVSAVTRAFSFGEAWLYGFKNSVVFVAYPGTKPVLPFLILGLVSLRKRKKELFYFIFSLMVWFAVLGKMVWGGQKVNNEDIAVMSVFFLPSLPILYCLASEGVSSLLLWLNRSSSTAFPAFVSYAFAILFPMSLLPFSYMAADLSKTQISYDYGRDMLSCLPVKSLLLNYHDNPTFIVFYMRAVERLREDVLVMDTAGKKDIYGLESSPRWKYAGLYPDFYRRKKSTLREINADFADNGKLFSNNPEGLTKIVSEYYYYYPYLFTAALYPKDMDVAARDRLKSDVRNRFKANYGNIAYEHAQEAPLTDDFLVNELLTIYSFNTILYADFMKREDRVYPVSKLYERAFATSDPGKYLWPFTYFLLEDGRQDEAFALIRGLKKAEGGYALLAKRLEQQAFSVVERSAQQ